MNIPQERSGHTIISPEGEGIKDRKMSPTKREERSKVNVDEESEEEGFLFYVFVRG